MKGHLSDNMLDKMFKERGDASEKYLAETLSKKEHELYEKLENKLKEKYSQEEVFDIIETVSALCNINCKVYYKVGVVEGFELSSEINEMYYKMNGS